MTKAKLINISAILAAIILLIFVLGYFATLRNNSVAMPAPNSVSNANSNQQTAGGVGELPIFSEMMATGGQTASAEAPIGVVEIILRLLLSVILSAILAFRPRRNVPLFRRNLYVAQTQILLAVVAAALMMIVGDNAARAFAIFAAVSLVRFRTNIRDPKEITVLLISLALGLAAGVGRWELGLSLCLFALALLWVLEFNEPEQVFRSMELTVKTRDTDASQDLLKRIFERHKLEAEVRQIDPPDEAGQVGSIMYYLTLRLNLSTDNLSDEILAADPENIDGIEWKQKKNSGYIYQ